MATVLYNSGDVHKTIQHLLQKRTPGDRTVILAAYVGGAATAYIPSPAGVHIVCNPTPGATSARAVRELLRRGARVEFSDRLHMKVYWSSSRGCVITSANLTANALARNGLREAGVFLPAGTVDIDRLLKLAAPRAVTARDLATLDQGRPQRGGGTQPIMDASVDFLAWAGSAFQQPWKLGVWSDNDLDDARTSRARVKREYGLSEPATSINMAKERQAHSGDWLLCFETRARSVTGFSWMYVDFVVPVAKDDKGAYEADYPFQAVQVHPLRLCPEPPFTITDGFKEAFQTAIRSTGTAWLWELESLKPPPKLLRSIEEHMRRAATTRRAV